MSIQLSSALHLIVSRRRSDTNLTNLPYNIVYLVNFVTKRPFFMLDFNSTCTETVERVINHVVS